MSAWLSVPLRLLLFTTGLMASVMPRRLEMWLGPILGRIVLALGLFKHEIAAENIRRCFPELGPDDRKRLLERNYEHYGILFFEYLHFFSPLKDHYRRYMKRHSVLEGFEHWKRANAKGKGVLFVANHVGFWEMLAAGGALRGIPLTIVTTVLKPAWLDEKITAQRLSTGVRPAYHPGSAKVILRALRKGESVAFMNDQYTPRALGLPVRFFGVKVSTLSAVGPLAKRTGAAIVPVGTYRDKNGLSHVVIQPEMALNGILDDPHKTTEALAAQVEQWVRKHPEQWLWIHRRFKHVTWPSVPA